MKIKFDYSLAHFAKDLRPHHGPQVWPWWKVFSLGLYRLEISKPHTGYRLWLYTRWGAGFVDARFIRAI